MITTRRSRQVTHADHGMIESAVSDAVIDALGARLGLDHGMIESAVSDAVIDALGARLGLDHEAVITIKVNTRQLVESRVRLDKLSGDAEVDWCGVNDHAADIAVTLLSQRLAQ